MAYICAHCGSGETQVLVDKYQCMSCGQLTGFDGKKAKGGMNDDTKAALESRMADRVVPVTGNLADLQRWGADQAGKDSAAPMPPGDWRDTVTPAEADAAQGLETRETERTGEGEGEGKSKSKAKK